MKNAFKKSITILLSMGIVATLMMGCSKKANTNSSQSSTKHLNAALTYMEPSLDPHKGYNGWVTVRSAITECLVKLDEEIKVEACIAKSWKNIDDNTWEFVIDEKAKFSNGKDVTAQVVKENFERVLKENSRALELSLIEEMHAEGKTLTIKTSKPNAALLNNLVEPVFSIIDLTQEESTFDNAPIGTGAYVVTNFVPEESIKLKKNENYWNGEVGCDTINLTYISDADSRAMAIQSGEIDLANMIDNSSMDLFNNNSKYNVSKVDNLRVNTAHMNTTKASALNDVELRKAVAHAANRQAYAQVIGATAARSCYSDATPFGNDKITPITFDIEKAKDILNNAGYKDINGDGYVENKDGSSLKLIYLQVGSFGSSNAQTIATAFQADLKSIGINMEIQALESSGHVSPDRAWDFYTSQNNSAITGDPQDYLKRSYTKEGVSGYNNPKIDEIVEQLYTTFDTQKRYDLASKASQILNDDASDVFFTNGYINMVSSQKVKNAKQVSCDYYYIDSSITIK